MGALEFACQVLLAVVFGTAALSKLGRGSFDGFVRALPSFGIPVRRATPAVAAAVIGAEAAVVALVFIAPGAAFLVSVGLLAGFSAGLAGALRRGERVSCRCFGRSDAPVGPEHLVRNAALLAVTALGLALELAAPPAPPLPVAAGSALLGLVLGALLTRWDDLVFIVRGPPARPRNPSAARR